MSEPASKFADGKNQSIETFIKPGNEKIERKGLHS